MKYRNELKYRLNYQDYQVVKTRLDAVLPKDIHTHPGGFYTVRSLYFDDFQNSAYNQKLFGLKDRQKYRIRIYNHSDKYINLERKIKTYRYIHKQVCRITREEVYQILEGKYEFLLKSEKVLQQLFYIECVSNILRPRVVVEYEREPYVLDVGQLRITFDKNVRTGELGFDIFDENMPMVEVFEPGLIIMEVKYSEFLPTMIQRLLPSKASDYGAFSKFVLGCNLNMYKRIFDS
jgi:hypothetical protein